ncbi:MAG: SRPBCC domain-containing protein [Bacteroidota bacterium]|nr:SRPBCC domain-containing protein [Bacteroidota bacterium]
MNHLQFDFLVDKEKNTLTIRREFRANRQMVWDAYTQSELLDQWFAPEPLIAKTKSMDFREGGHWLYAMVEPNGTAHWGRTEFLEIKPIDYYTTFDAFCNEVGEINKELPGAHWMIQFSDKGEHSLVETIVTYNSLGELETIIQMGMKEGLTATLQRLDKLLFSLTNK